MIIYEATVNEFKEHIVNQELVGLITNNLKTKFGIRVSDSEKRSWYNSLPAVLDLLEVSERDERIVLCEFNIPTSKKRIDIIILGKNKLNVPSAWILELKQWSHVTQEEFNKFKVGRYSDSHPSSQASDYKFRLQHQMGMNNDVDIKASAFLHNMKNKETPLFNKSYFNILEKAMLYIYDDKKELSKLINGHTIVHNGAKAVEYFKSATWKPTKKFKEIVMENFQSINLVGTQKIIYNQIENFIKTAEVKKQKLTFLISGDPGCGKTVIAFKLLNLMTMGFNNDIGVNVQMMIPGQEVREAFKYELTENILSSKISGANMWKGYDAVIIDEGHKAIGRDIGNINYERNYKQIELAIIFVDDDQVINKKGITKDEIKLIAEKHNHKVHEYKIEENFRSLGERMLLDWIDHVFYNRKTINGEFEYQQVSYNNSNQNYKLHSYTNAKAFTDLYFSLRRKYKRTRIVSLWHKGYYIGDADENGLPKSTFSIGTVPFIWNPNKEWADKVAKNHNDSLRTYNNHVKKYMVDRKLFLTGNPNPKFIAYFNHIQGYEFDNIFVYIPNVFTYENDKLIFHRDRLADEVRISQTWVASSKSLKVANKTSEQIYEINKRFFINRIKVMLTRGVYSTHIYAQDRALNKYIHSKISW